MMTVHNVQARFCCRQDSLQAYIGWLLSYLSSVDAPLVVDSLTDVDMPITSTTLLCTLKQVLTCKETVLSSCTVIVVHKSAEEVRRMAKS